MQLFIVLIHHFFKNKMINFTNEMFELNKNRSFYASNLRWIGELNVWYAQINISGDKRIESTRNNNKRKSKQWTNETNVISSINYDACSKSLLSSLELALAVSDDVR